MHTIVTNETGFAVVFSHPVAVGAVVAAEERLVRQFGLSEWDFMQATELCQKLNGGTVFDHEVLDHMTTALNRLNPILEGAEQLFEIGLPKMLRELQNG